MQVERNSLGKNSSVFGIMKCSNRTDGILWFAFIVLMRLVAWFSVL